MEPQWAEDRIHRPALRRRGVLRQSQCGLSEPRRQPRLVIRGKYNYHTPSNILKRVKTPGGRLTLHKVRKVRNPVVCGDTGVQLNGIKRLDKCQWKNAPKRVRTVSRTYGGVLSSSAVRHRIMRAFLNEELKCIKKARYAPKNKGKKGGQQQQKKKK